MKLIIALSVRFLNSFAHISPLLGVGLSSIVGTTINIWLVGTTWSSIR